MEHVIQDAIGGWDCIWEVCGLCNKGFSGIDNNLAVRSPLSILALREIGETGPRSWAHAPDRPGLLLEASGQEGTDAPKYHPQIVFEEDGLRFYCDHDEIDRLGAETIQDTFYSRLRRAYDHFCIFGPNARRKDHRRKDMLKIQRVERLMLGERLPPRIFSYQQISEFNDEVIFELKYHFVGHDNRILEQLSKFDWNHRAEKSDRVTSSNQATVRFSFSLTDVMRAVAKIGFNLLAYHCKTTSPSIANFRRTVEWITQCDHTDTFGDDSKFGFIHPADLAPLGCSEGEHRFRLTHDHATNIWHMYAAFFSGKAGVYVAFKGPSLEDWATMDIVAPYERPMLAPVFSKLYLPLTVRVTKNQREMIPSIPWTRGEVLETRTVGLNDA